MKKTRLLAITLATLMILSVMSAMVTFPAAAEENWLNVSNYKPAKAQAGPSFVNDPANLTNPDNGWRMTNWENFKAIVDLGDETPIDFIQLFTWDNWAVSNAIYVYGSNNEDVWDNDEYTGDNWELISDFYSYSAYVNPGNPGNAWISEAQQQGKITNPFVELAQTVNYQYLLFDIGRNAPVSRIAVSCKDVPVSIDESGNYKSNYVIGESFEHDKLDVEVTLTSGATFNPAFGEYTITPEFFSAGDTKATITYGNLTVDIPINIVPKTQVGIEAELLTGTTLFVGDTLSSANVNVYAVYDYGYRELVQGFNASPSTLTTAGQDIKITVSTTSPAYTCDLYVDVLAVELTGIEITTPPAKIGYIEGQTFSTTGMVVSKVYNNGTKVATTAYTIDKTSPLLTTDTDVTVSYFEDVLYTKTVAITVAVKEVVGVEITALPTKLSYIEEQMLNTTGMVVSKVYNSGEKEVLDAAEYIVSPSELNEVGTETITVTYGAFEDTFTVAVAQKQVTAVSFVSEPTKKAYTPGEALNLTGGVVKVNYDNGKSENVNITSAMVTGFNNKLVGTQTLTVAIGGLTLSYRVNVASSVAIGSLTVGTATGKAGDTINVTVSIANNPGIMMMVLGLNYDSSVLKLKAVNDTSSVLSDPMHSGDLTLVPFNMSWFMLNGTPGYENTSNGLVVTLSFEILAGADIGTTDIVINYATEDIIDSDFVEVPFNVVNGSVTVIPSKKAGDANGDGAINASDASIIRQHALGGYTIATINMINADANDDTNVNASDASIVRQYALGGYGVELSSDGSKLYIP